MSEDIPQWAAEEAYKRLAKACDAAHKLRFARDGIAVHELGRMIAKHELPPVDPLQEALRETYGGAAPEFVSAFRSALKKRGLQIVAKEQP